MSMAMLRRISSHLSRNVVAYAALFVALGGTSYAAVSLPANSVGTLQLRNGAVSGPKIRAGAITADKVRDGSLLLRDFAPGQLRIAVKTAKGPGGPAGPPGATGPVGAAGPQGPPGATNVTIRSVYGSVGADGRYTATAVCHTGERAVGGGAALIGGANSNDHLLSSRPALTTASGGFGAGSTLPNDGDTPNAWTAEMYSAVAGRMLTVYAVCAAP
jgi:hypothetical protein